MSKKRSPAAPRCDASEERRRSTRNKAKKPGGGPRNRRELAERIFAQRDPVAVGRELLDAQSESVKARAFETLTDWRYGAAEGAGAGGSVRIVWDLPAPPRESH